MAAEKWTTEQKAAIDLEGTLLVAAAAGSGKTAVLVERLVKRITNLQNPVNLDRLLVVTFTKAAAGEMAERVRLGLERALFEESDPRQSERLLEQIALLEQANICNLHSFCLDLLRRYFYHLALDPAFRVADPSEIYLLRQDVLTDLLEQHYQQMTPHFEQLNQALASDRSDQSLVEIILRLSDFSASQVDPVSWLQSLPEPYRFNNQEDFLHSPWGKAIRQKIYDDLHAAITHVQEALSLCRLPGGPDHYIETLESDCNELSYLFEISYDAPWDVLSEKFLALKFATLPRTTAPRLSIKMQEKVGNVPFSHLTDEKVKEIQTRVRKLRDEMKKICKGLATEFYIWTLDEQIQRLNQQETLINTLTSLTIEFETMFSNVKRRRNVIDYGDMEHLTLKLLENEGQPTSVAIELRQQFQEVMIDEYQDTNPIQERLLQLLIQTGEQPAGFFMVGDIKQSIYRFRMADPRLFLAKYKQFPHLIRINPSTRDQTAKQGMVIDLSRNFRSRKEIVAGINFIFSQIMTPGVGDIEYDELAALEYGANYPEAASSQLVGGPIEVHCIDMSAECNLTHDNVITREEHSAPEECSVSEDRFDSEDISVTEDSFTPAGLLTPEEALGIRQEARSIAKQIRFLIHTEALVFDKSYPGYRPIRYSDMVILLRAVHNTADVFAEEFQSAGIPLYAESKSGYFGTSEIDTMLSLLRIIDNPHQDIPLCGVLRSMLVGLNGKELGKMRSLHPHADFYELMTLFVWMSIRNNLNETAAGSLVEDHELQNQQETAEMQEILSSFKDHWDALFTEGNKVLGEVPELQDKLRDFWTKLQNWRTLSRRVSLPDLIWQIYEESGYLNYVGAMPNGRQRQANLHLLYERARQFESTRSRGLFKFLRFLEKFHQQGQDLGNARILEENENIVRILTVHGSKGLEFPVVFLAGLSRQFNRRDYIQEKVLLHGELGIGLPIMDLENHVEYPSLIRLGIRQQLFQESIAEEMRVLYVAMTRAKEKLYLYASVKDLDSALSKWNIPAMEEGGAFSEPVLRRAKCFLDWIVPSLLRHPEIAWVDNRNQITWNNENGGRILPWSDSPWGIHIHVPESHRKTISEPGIGQFEPTATKGVTDHSPEIVSDQTEIASVPETNWLPLIDQRLNWKYPFEAEVSRETKLSVSEIKRRFQSETAASETARQLILPETGFNRPRFWQEINPISAAERGTIMHTVLQHLPFQAWQPIWSQLDQTRQHLMIKNYLDSLIQQEMITNKQIDVIDLRDIASFLKTELAGRIGSCLITGELRREVPFTLSLSADQGNPVLVQGIIDLILLPDLHTAEIIDYKTDYFHPGYDLKMAEKEFEHRYTLQLGLYALAVERLLRVEVINCSIYSFALHQELNIPFREILARLRQGIIPATL